MVVEDKMLQDVLGRLTRQRFEAIVEIQVKLRAYNGKRRTIARRFRLVAVRNDETKSYHLYLTNTEPDRLHADDVAAVYALRWQVELLFKQLRQMGRIDHLPSTQPHIVEALIYSAVLALALSKRILRAMRQQVVDRSLLFLRFYEVFRTYAGQLLLELSAHHRDGPPDLFAMMLHETVDPNLIRPRSEDVLWNI